ncbi:MAG: hypothetical protein WC231_01335 [Dehalococcoidales bacterium]|jgi:hypothetical protein|nr:hypothetical protein [Dehalococcoidales bacterium]
MKSGEKPPRGLKKYVISLASSNPRPTNKEIREAVDRKFETGISDRTICRYCTQAGLPTKSIQKPENIDTKQREADVGKEKQRRQIEHIQQLQLLARNTRSAVGQIPHSQNDQELDGEYLSLLLVAYQLANDALWGWLAHHLGDEAQKIESLKNECGTTLRKISSEDRGNQVSQARQLLLNSLYPIAIYGNTEEWQVFGLKAQCPGCYI